MSGPGRDTTVTTRNPSGARGVDSPEMTARTRIPAIISVSAKLMPQARTRMRASFGFSGRAATSSNRRLSGPPHSRQRIAFIQQA